MGLTLKKASVEKAIRTLEAEKKEYEKAQHAKLAEYQKAVKAKVPDLIEQYESHITGILKAAKAALAAVKKNGVAVAVITTEQNIRAFNEAAVVGFGDSYNHGRFSLPTPNELFGTRNNWVRVGRRQVCQSSPTASWPGEAKLNQLRGLLNLFSGPEVVLSNTLAEKLLGSDEGMLSLLA